tara:strand:+ start:20746 stop:20898 length:153 start_codon:yes stop_codon:yes gene_type:complete
MIKSDYKIDEFLHISFHLLMAHQYLKSITSIFKKQHLNSKKADDHEDHQL